eukprot:6186957-Pleurochrysis_carterae.AAC.1
MRAASAELNRRLSPWLSGLAPLIEERRGFCSDRVQRTADFNGKDCGMSLGQGSFRDRSRWGSHGGSTVLGRPIVCVLVTSSIYCAVQARH